MRKNCVRACAAVALLVLAVTAGCRPTNPNPRGTVEGRCLPDGTCQGALVCVPGAWEFICVPKKEER